MAGDELPCAVLELVYTAWDLKPFAEDMRYRGEPFRWNEERRVHLRAKLDAYYAHLYGLTRDDCATSSIPKTLTVQISQARPSACSRRRKSSSMGSIGRTGWCWRSGMRYLGKDEGGRSKQSSEIQIGAVR